MDVYEKILNMAYNLYEELGDGYYWALLAMCIATCVLIAL